MSRRTLPSHGGIHTPQMACYLAAHDYQDGVPALAAILQVTPDTLNKKLSPKNTSHILSLQDAMHILRITHDTRILDAICAQVSAIWARPEDVSDCPGDLDLLKTSNGLMARAVAVIEELELALEDGAIDAEERARLDQCFMRLSQEAHHVSETARRFEEE
ncbi:phage regulatory CII family protein [Neptuniibacter sp. CAU 1671]|uniref:phage regulatory CII family protein n=1 Tax=Neptuniibacter sp. CAU 1671 TaxID=3032593 RepID=UPI0023DC97B1|nr:phage regulatory CII family protein [Neptuniibacter sp. CAU 1671]MDF2180971.1 hypothetical protein [Neptuniibacter sp. CAU 1671]